MGRNHRLKIEPGSDAEKRFMELLKSVDVEPNSVMCRLGAVFETPYNEYILSDGLYQQIRESLIREKI